MSKWKYLKWLFSMKKTTVLPKPDFTHFLHLRGIYWKFPTLRPLMVGIHDIIFPSSIKFSGWGMTTRHELPWNDDYDWGSFRKAAIDIKTQFDFNETSDRYPESMIDTFLYRHWIVSYAVRCAIKFAEDNEYNFVECGTSEGKTAFFALREIYEHKKIVNNFTMHLYDEWGAMKNEGLTEDESMRTGDYAELSIDRTKKHLVEFSDKIIYHQGHIPESLSALPEPPNSIVFLHIDLNSAQPTIDTLNFFLPRLSKRGIILFDDYGWIQYKDTRNAIDEFFSNKNGVLQKLPTGQAIYYQ